MTATVIPTKAAAVQLPPSQLAGSSGHDQSQEPVALLELFTSEGCSSCPPADETLAQLTDEAATSGQRMFTLELHVDHWNSVGWVDPFSDKIHSARQGAYARRLDADRVYTSQLVINGREETVGSTRAAARSAIARALATPARVAVAVTARPTGGGLELAYRVGSSLPVDFGAYAD